MDFIPTEDQEALRGAVREVLTRDFTREHLQAAGDAPETARLGSFRLWNALSEMGVFTVRLPEAAGGLGGGLVDAALILEELGKALVPGPLVGTVLAAGRLPGIEPGAPVGVVEARRHTTARRASRRPAGTRRPGRRHRPAGHAGRR